MGVVLIELTSAHAAKTLAKAFDSKNLCTDMYHKSVPAIRNKLDSITHDIRNLVHMGDNLRKFYASLVTHIEEVQRAKKLRLVKTYTVSKQNQISQRLYIFIELCVSLQQ